MDKTIMIIDDSTSLRQMVSFTLVEAGYTVIEAEDGNEGVQKLKNTRVNMIITDLNMPNMNGISVIRAVRAMPEYQYIPIIVLTTESQAQKKEESREAGATGWITKPFKPDQLLAVVKKVMA